MAFKLPRNSLFAILLRSPWWISFAIAGALSLVAMSLLPEAYRVVGALSSLPFVVIGIMAVRRQWSLPGAQEIERTARVLSSLTWQQFAPLARAALTEEGRVVRDHRGSAADFILHDAQGCRLVMAKRWKSARLGVEALRELTGRSTRQARARACSFSGRSHRPRSPVRRVEPDRDLGSSGLDDQAEGQASRGVSVARGSASAHLKPTQVFHQPEQTRSYVRLRVVGHVHVVFGALNPIVASPNRHFA